MKSPTFSPFKMAKSDSSCLSTTFHILPELQYFYLGRIRNDSAPMVRYWFPSLFVRRRHHEKQKYPKVPSCHPYPSSSLNSCCCTQYQPIQCSSCIISIALMRWFCHFTDFYPFRVGEEEMVQSDSATGNKTSGMVYSMDCEKYDLSHSIALALHTPVQMPRPDATEVALGTGTCI